MDIGFRGDAVKRIGRVHGVSRASACQPVMIECEGRRSERLHSRRHFISTSAALIGIGLASGVVRAAQAQGQSEGKVKVAFVGDSTGDGIWGGLASLVPHEPCLKGNVELGRFAKNSTGLTRPEKFNWVEELKRIGETFKPQLFVMSLGLNDRQSVVEHGKVTLENSPDYPARYKERVTAVLKSAAGSKASLLWIGLPAMREAAADRDAREKNRYFAESIAAFTQSNSQQETLQQDNVQLGSMQYVEPWKLNSSGEDKFASFGPDQKGKMVQIRASDGEHFSPAGDLLVAAYLLPRIVATLVKGGVKLGEGCAS